ncbi:MAG: FapA family protein [Sulfurimonas sp.]|uniref:flagellar assembly protein A n=1 Tax=Sulfurimonas sp. TaxID=2022749 RepID=UPI0026084BE7|nr:flagellar assembly protein A [Sulfurimonas sp.]MDD2652797.1 FapA family protein [Sulfurimonas sp.]MDD3452108.1 FapA family protein [Sulfurimonas sp.]
MICLLTKKFKTKNIVTTIEKFALENNCSPLEFSFAINEIETYIKSTSDDTFKIYNEDSLNYYDNPQKMVNEHLRIKQIYTITVKQAPKQIIKLNYSIDFSPNNAHPALVLHPESQIPYTKYQPKEIFLLLFKEFNNIKAANGILINLFDEEMKEKLKTFVKYLYAGKFVKKVKIPLFKGIDPEIRRSSKLLMRFLEKESHLQVIEVVEDEILVEYIKPVFGKNGFNAFGDIIDNASLKNVDDLKCKIDAKGIEIIENSDRKIYRSKVKGYVHFDTQNFYIDNKIKMQSLSRIQERVAKDEANNIEVIIAQHDTSLDSLGEGVELISEAIHIHGHVGAKSSLRAVNLTIDGATHKDSVQEAKFAFINRHKGKLRCHSAKIKLLEGGEIHATNVEVENSLGGAIYAENITISHVKSNLKVYASNSITVKLVGGEDNLFKINYKEISTLKSKYNHIAREIDDFKYKLEGAKKHSPAKIQLYKEKIDTLKATQEHIINSAMHAKITVQEPFRGMNTIVFTIANDEDILFKTEAMSYDPFYLIASENSITLHPTNKKISIE